MVVKKVTALYTLNKMKRVLRQSYSLYRKKAKTVAPTIKKQIEAHLSSLQTALLQKDAVMALRIGTQLEEMKERLLPKTWFDKCKEFIRNISVALVVAVAIRTMWFEPYTIPTGSMRPTLKEGDFLLVSKTDYGINVPLRPAHLYFDPSLVQRGGIFVFSSENMDVADADTKYFYLFPGKKLFVKRLIAKPGDTLYFYGGQIYGINAQGRELTVSRDTSWFQPLEYIPFIRFDGKVETSHYKQGLFHTATFYQMNKPIAKLSVTPFGTVSGEMITQKGKPSVSQYSDIWGFKNYAMARLLTQEQLDQMHPSSALEPGVLYLELTHHPTIQGSQVIRDEHNRLRPQLNTSTSILPLTEQQVAEIGRHLTTCRFIVVKGVAYRYGLNVKNPESLPYLPKLPGVPDGTYEIQNGKAYRVLWGSVTRELPPNHPLYNTSAEHIQLLYNLGIEFLTYYNPAKNSPIFPSRYAYFRNQDLYLLNAPIVKKDDPNLILFLKKEYQKQSISTSIRPYVPFDDSGPPLTSDGKIDVDFIRKHGLVIPDKMYLALGDNHAMSADSRQFGFVPENNIRGGPCFVFWPSGPRWGTLPQPLYPHLTFPNLFIWGSALLIILLSSYYYRRTLQKPLRFEKTAD